MFNQLYICLGALVACASIVVTMGAFRLRRYLVMNGVGVSLQSGDALAVPLSGSMVLFTFYVLLRFIPKNVFNILISFYLSVFSVFALGNFLKGYVRPNIVTGSACVAIGVWYFMTGNWVANDVLAFAMGVTALENVPVNNFSTSFLLLIGLFFYDIFWVFGSDVMLTVATGVNGPIKLLFPHTIFGDHTKKSLLGLGDLIVPGLFIAQTLIFSMDVAKRGTFYLRVAILAYVASLVNTMAVMLIFRHGQPALLFIVPWLLITFLAAAAWKGDLKKAWSFDVAEVFPEVVSDEKKDTVQEDASDESLISALCSAVLDLFGFGKPAEPASKKRKDETPTNSAEKIKTA